MEIPLEIFCFTFTISLKPLQLVCVAVHMCQLSVRSKWYTHFAFSDCSWELSLSRNSICCGIFCSLDKPSISWDKRWSTIVVLSVSVFLTQYTRLSKYVNKTKTHGQARVKHVMHFTVCRKCDQKAIWAAKYMKNY